MQWRTKHPYLPCTTVVHTNSVCCLMQSGQPIIPDSCLGGESALCAPTVTAGIAPGRNGHMAKLANFLLMNLPVDSEAFLKLLWGSLARVQHHACGLILPSLSWHHRRSFTLHCPASLVLFSLSFIAIVQSHFGDTTVSALFPLAFDLCTCAGLQHMINGTTGHGPQKCNQID